MLLQVNTFLQGARNPHARASIHMAIAWLATVICLTFLVSAQDTRPQQPGNPIVAHITMPLSDCTSFATPPPGVDASGGCVNILYVKWLAAVGVRTVPIAWNAVWEDVQRILDSTNGVLLPGGDLTGAEWTAYQQNMKAVVDYTKRRNQDGDPFVLWGTCQGFQVVATILADDPSILRCNLKGVEGVQLPLNMTSSALGSVMFPTSTQSTGMYQLFSTKPVTLNLHSCGISPQDWDQKDLLRSQYKVLATNVDSTGKTFISAYEGVNTNILAVQFHPERTQFEFDASFILHTDDDMDAAWYLARLLRNRLQQCLLHRYNTPESANAALIDTYPVTLLGWGKGYYWVPQNGQATAPAQAVGGGGDRNFASVAWTLGLMTILAGIVTAFFIMFCRRRPVVRAPPQPAGVYDVGGKGTIVDGSVIS